MKESFRKVKLGKKNLETLSQANTIIEEYAEMGYTLTLRQLYYRLVTKNIVKNEQREYSRLIKILTEGRMSGMVDWDGIEDRVRVPRMAAYESDPKSAVIKAANHFRLNRQEGQKNHVELWVEKDAISNILKVKTNYYGIYLMVNRGFSSTTAMYEAANRMKRAVEDGKECHILYLGDHDPSGLYMAVKDIPERLNEAFGVPVNVDHIGITISQVREYNPPPNPAKITDTRSAWYMKQFGKVSWEVDALEPPILHSIIDSKVSSLMDMEMFNEVMSREDDLRNEIRKMPDSSDKLHVAEKKIEEVSESLNDAKLVSESLRVENIDIERRLSGAVNELGHVKDELMVAKSNNDSNLKRINSAKLYLDSFAPEKASGANHETIMEYQRRVISMVNHLKDQLR